MLNTLEVLLDEKSVKSYLDKDYDVLLTHVGYEKAINSGMYTSIITTDLLSFNQAQNNYEKVILTHFDEDKNKCVKVEVWPDTSSWNTTEKEVRQAHILRKLLMPYIEKFIYTEEEIDRRGYNFAKQSSITSGSSMYSGKNKNYYFVKGEEVSYEDFSRFIEVYD